MLASPICLSGGFLVDIGPVMVPGWYLAARDCSYYGRDSWFFWYDLLFIAQPLQFLQFWRHSNGWAMNSKSYQKNQKCRPQCEQPPAARYQPGTITGLMSTEKPPDMQIGLDSIYCPAECQFFPILGWLGSPIRVPKCRIQLFGWKTTTGRTTAQG